MFNQINQETAHSQIIEENNLQKVIVHFERQRYVTIIIKEFRIWVQKIWRKINWLIIMIPKKLKPFVNDYKINLVEVAFLDDQLDNFHSEKNADAKKCSNLL